MVAERDTLPARSLLTGPSKRCHQVVVAGDLEGLLERFEIIGADEDEGGPSVASNQHAFVLALDPVGEVG